MTTITATSQLETLIEYGWAKKASDWHFTTGEPLGLRVNGDIEKTGDALSGDEISSLLTELLGADASNGLKILSERPAGQIDRDVAFINSSEQRRRFRLHAKRCYAGLGFTLRRLPEKPAKMEELNTPQAFRSLLKKKAGLILVTGQTGSGKTTTLGAVIEWLNQNFAYKIATYEAPIEILFTPARSIIEQHDVGNDVASFSAALRSAMREDPDVVMFGELREPEAVVKALDLSETGHLVLSTLHTGNAIASVSRLLECAPAGESDFFRSKLSTQLLAVLSQRLITGPKGGQMANYELLINNAALAAQIYRGDYNQLKGTMVTGQKDGMFSFAGHLGDLVSNGTMTVDQAFLGAASGGGSLQEVLDQVRNRKLAPLDKINLLKSQYSLE